MIDRAATITTPSRTTITPGRTITTPGRTITTPDRTMTTTETTHTTSASFYFSVIKTTVFPGKTHTIIINHPFYLKLMKVVIFYSYTLVSLLLKLD